MSHKHAKACDKNGKQMHAETCNIRLSKQTINRLRKFKGSKTWDELFELWLNHFEGFSKNDDEIKYITNGDWEELINRIKVFEDRIEHIDNNKRLSSDNRS